MPFARPALSSAGFIIFTAAGRALLNQEMK